MAFGSFGLLASRISLSTSLSRFSCALSCLLPPLLLPFCRGTMVASAVAVVVGTLSSSMEPIEVAARGENGRMDGWSGGSQNSKSNQLGASTLKKEGRKGKQNAGQVVIRLSLSPTMSYKQMNRDEIGNAEKTHSESFHHVGNVSRSLVQSFVVCRAIDRPKSPTTHMHTSTEILIAHTLLVPSLFVAHCLLLLLLLLLVLLAHRPQRPGHPHQGLPG